MSDDTQYFIRDFIIGNSKNCFGVSKKKKTHLSVGNVQFQLTNLLY